MTIVYIVMQSPLNQLLKKPLRRREGIYHVGTTRFCRYCKVVYTETCHCVAYFVNFLKASTFIIE